MPIQKSKLQLKLLVVVVYRRFPATTTKEKAKPEYGLLIKQAVT
jgi:hypothetical protein